MAAITSTATGDWSAGATWVGGVAPGDGDSAIIAATHVVTVDGDITIGPAGGSGVDAITISGTMDFGTLTGARILTVKGDITVDATGAIIGDANGNVGKIRFDNATTDLLYEIDASTDGCGFRLVDSSPPTARYTELAAQAASAQPQITVDDDLSADWKIGDTVLIGKHAHNVNGVEKEVIDFFTGTTINVVDNLNYTHDEDTGFYLLSRNWVIEPTNDSYRIRKIQFKDSTGTNIVSDNIWFRGIGDGSAGERGIEIESGFLGSFDNCTVEGVGATRPPALWIENATGNYTWENWLFYNCGGIFYNGSSSTNNTCDNCYFVGFAYSDILNAASNKTFEHFTNCRIDSSPTNAHCLGLDSTNVLSQNNVYRAVYMACAVYQSAVLFRSVDDTFELGTVQVARFGNSNYGNGTLINPVMTSGVISRNSPTAGSNLYVQRHNDTANDHRWYKPEGIMQTSGAGLDDATTRTVGELSLLIDLDQSANAEFEIDKAVPASSNIVMFGYMRKNASYGSATRPTVTLTSSDGSISTSATMTDVDNTWERFSLEGTVGASPCYITVKMEGESANAGANCYFADMQCIVGEEETATGYKIGTLWAQGKPTFDEGLGGNIDIEHLRTAVWDAKKVDHVTADTFGKGVGDTEKAAKLTKNLTV